MAAPLGTALITGATSGIGEIYADRLARRHTPVTEFTVLADEGTL